MSTTFEIYPQTISIPTFAEVVDLTSHKIHHFLKDYGITSDFVLTAELRTKEPDILHTNELTSTSFLWTDDQYAWFRIRNIPGGIDAYFWNLDDLNREYWGELLQQDRFRPHTELIKLCLVNGYFWSFRRSAGQPAVVTLSQGLLAAALAELTNGFIFTDDGAWDYKRFPATAKEFSEWYFQPKMALGDNQRRWAEKCIAHIPIELSGMIGETQ